MCHFLQVAHDINGLGYKRVEFCTVRQEFNGMPTFFSLLAECFLVLFGSSVTVRTSTDEAVATVALLVWEKAVL